jgi:hypothetical protein
MYLYFIFNSINDFFQEFTLPMTLASEQEFLACEHENGNTSLLSSGKSMERFSLLEARTGAGGGETAWSVKSNTSDRSIGLKNLDQHQLGMNMDRLSISSAAATASQSELALPASSHGSDTVLTPTSSLDSNHRHSQRKGYFGCDEAPELDIIEEKPVCLVAEDNALCQKIATKLLGRDYVVELADNGRIAVDTDMASPDRFSIIIMDIIMPEMDGLQATIELRKSGITCPIIA